MKAHSSILDMLMQWQAEGTSRQLRTMRKLSSVANLDVHANGSPHERCHTAYRDSEYRTVQYIRQGSLRYNQHLPDIDKLGVSLGTQLY